ncbi:MAG: T9SS type A sorting domain-containing protein [Bacteroidales bacterium]|nr:T9SS type A sorting domain-containing protein [Bacteroidales bacterium]
MSCNTGIVEFDITTGQVGSTIVSGDFQRTYLQTAPDGHIYGVSNDGAHLGRINMQSGIFEDDVFTIPGAQEGYIISTFRVFDNENYYILPENQQTYEYMTLELDFNCICPGSDDGRVTMYVTNGDPDFTYELFIKKHEQWQLYDEPVTTEENEYTFTGLIEGEYKCVVTDSNYRTADTTFRIVVCDYYFDLDDFITYDTYDPEFWTGLNTSYQKGFRITTDITISNSTIVFGKYGRIVIEPGATLTLNNSTLDYYEECSEKWRGVEVAGMSDSSQWNQAGEFIQGRLIMQNNARIKNAENGVSLYRCDYIYNEDENEYGRRINWDSAGGILIAKNSDFINNTRAVHFIPYRNYHPYTLKTIENISDFELCNFELNAAYIDSTTFYKHVDLHGVLGIDFKGCSFSNTAIDGVDTWNMGIAAYGSGFTVRSVCNTIGDLCPAGHWISSSFEGFRRGIATYYNNRYTNRMNVSEAQFSNNVKGIMDIAVPFVTIIDCDFEVGLANLGDGICGEPEGFGIDMQEAFGFAIENDTFTKFNQAPLGEYAGIRAKDCPSPNDIIYRNHFVGLSYGNYAQGNNRSKTGDETGLEYRCNTNIDNINDFIVTDTIIQNAKIRDHIGNYDTAAGNTFSQDTATKWHIRNDGEEVISYYYYQYDPLQVPDEDKITDYFVELIDDAEENLCPDHYTGGGGIRLVQDERLQKESDYNQNLIDYNAVLSQYESLKDGGDTEAELNDVQAAQPDDMWDLRAQLLGDSPHLSQEVLMETSDRTDVFPDNVLFDILAANPDELKEDTLLSYLENKEDPLPDYMISMLRDLAIGNITHKTILKNQMADHYSRKMQAAQDIVRSILNDSVLDVTDYRNWLDNMSCLEADKQIISSYFSEDDTASAMTLMNMIPDLYELEGEALDNFNDYKDLVLMQLNWKQNGKNIFELDSTDIAALEVYANGSSGSSRAMARSMLSFAYNYNFCDCLALNDSSYYKSSHGSNWNSLNNPYGPVVKVEPNPADTWVAFNYELNNKESVGYLKITSITGEVIKQFVLKGKKGQQIWDTRMVKPGVYLYTLMSDGLISTGKIVIK